ncbi:TPA: hypothetical protein NHR53_006822 [Pseudomonas aeruginosa]|uniref:hypothetical protein n=1 Tax=Pseudomonas aeruginosa TaxID=287 RepID=UPI0008037316|nr:hypothetical protein [Pseudomonas aeruginosa]OBY19331.1 hypothetical protein A8O37_29895 [Pseudomonas aeruginosa]HCE7247007.1 hypothetical protein [Pseudomonas aeruginosa]HCE8130195.1 hypothetical protein [Pseudomonas aeruginosa]HCF0446813.1 hypothetical protein [Pseudomonas aeruginosa]
MSLSNAVTTLMTRNLQKLGYPTDDIRWSLGYCQGDGSSFSGSLDIAVLGPRLLPEISQEIWASIDCDLEIVRSRSCHYVHERSVDLNIDTQCVEQTDASEYGGVAQKVALHKLVGALEDDILKASFKNSADGYKLIESFVSEDTLAWRFRTASFLVELFKINDEDCSPFDLYDEGDQLDGVISSILEGKTSIFGTKVVVSLLDDDGDASTVLAESYLGGFSCDSNDASLGGMRREIVSEAISMAREAYQKLLRPRLKAAA